jgi:hypothetical protein
MRTEMLLRQNVKDRRVRLFTDEAMRVLAMMPKWSPGKQGGKKVSVIMTLPFRFKLVN